MPDKDVVLAKTATIQRCIKRIHSVTGLIPKSLEDFDKQDIFILNLQRAIQASIDLAAHVVASEKLGLTQSLKEHFSFLKLEGIIDGELCSKMKKMTGFRNIAVHDYQSIDIDILKSILINNLKDLEDFYTSVVKHFKLSK